MLPPAGSNRSPVSTTGFPAQGILTDRNLDQIGVESWLVSEIHGLVGIETLSKSLRAVTATDGVLQTDLLLLDPLQDDSSVRILLPPEQWEAGIPMQLFIDGHPWRLHPDEALAAGNEWLMGRCIAEALDSYRR